MSKELYLIRHGQTQANVDRKVYGRSNFDLTPTGVEEAETLALHLLEQKICPEVIYASPLLRAKRTAEIVQAKVGGIIKSRDQLMEMNYGDYEGCDRETSWDIEFGYHTEKMKLGNGETVADIEGRVKEVLNEIVQGEQNTNLIVAHGMTISVMSQMLMDMERTFANVQALRNADYNYFLFDVNDQGGIVVVNRKNNVLRGPMEFKR